MVILRIAGANLAVPVEREANLVELLAVAVDVVTLSTLLSIMESVLR